MKLSVKTQIELTIQGLRSKCLQIISLNQPRLSSKQMYSPLSNPYDLAISVSFPLPTLHSHEKVFSGRSNF